MGLWGRKVHTPMTVFDLTFDQPGRAKVLFPEGFTTLVFVLNSGIRIQGKTAVPKRGLAVFPSQASGDIIVDATEAGAKLLFLAGEPLGEPVVQHGPFVMNSREEIHQAIRDYQMGRMGGLRPKE